MHAVLFLQYYKPYLKPPFQDRTPPPKKSSDSIALKINFWFILGNKYYQPNIYGRFSGARMRYHHTINNCAAFVSRHKNVETPPPPTLQFVLMINCIGKCPKLSDCQRKPHTSLSVSSPLLRPETNCWRPLWNGKYRHLLGTLAYDRHFHSVMNSAEMTIVCYCLCVCVSVCYNIHKCYPFRCQNGHLKHSLQEAATSPLETLRTSAPSPW